MDHPLHLSVEQLRDKGKRHFEVDLEPEALENPLNDQAALAGPVRIELDATWRDGAVQLEGRARGEWALECCRCIKVTRSRFDVKIDSVIEEAGASVDAVEEIRQILLLAVPTQPYCREDCKGLCPSCGVNRNEKQCGCVTTPPSRFKIIKRGRQENA